jgi:hypothetical protein
MHGPSHEKTGALPSFLKMDTAFSPAGHIPFAAGIVRRMASLSPPVLASLFESHPISSLQFDLNHSAHLRRNEDTKGYKKAQNCKDRKHRLPILFKAPLSPPGLALLPHPIRPHFAFPHYYWRLHKLYFGPTSTLLNRREFVVCGGQFLLLCMNDHV